MTLLTERESQVLQLLCNGYTNKEIGAELSIAGSTATQHVGVIMGKLQVTHRAAAAAEAIRRQLAA